MDDEEKTVQGEETEDQLAVQWDTEQWDFWSESSEEGRGWSQQLQNFYIEKKGPKNHKLNTFSHI